MTYLNDPNWYAGMVAMALVSCLVGGMAWAFVNRRIKP